MPTTRSTGRGFAGMDKEKQREIASLGGRAAHASGNAHEWTSAEAREAGRRGGIAAHQQRGTAPTDAQKGGGTATPPAPPPERAIDDDEAEKASASENAAEYDDDRNPRYAPTPEPQRIDERRPVPGSDIGDAARRRGRAEMTSEGDYR